MQQLNAPSAEVQAQLQREKSQRDFALGRRMKSLEDGEVSPIVRRWANASVMPVSKRLRAVSRAILNEDIESASDMLSTPSLGVVNALSTGLTATHPLMTWTLRGSSPGRQSQSTTSFAEDLVLTQLGSLLSRLVIQEAKRNNPTNGVSLNVAIAASGRALRECVLGQWVTTMQGAKALTRLSGRLQSGKGGTWKRKSELDGIANLLLAQAKPQIESEDRGEVELESVGCRKVVKVIEPWSQNERRLELKKPDSIDWQVLRMARRVQGEPDEFASEWSTFAFIILCAIQRELGWFDLVKTKSTHRKASKRHKARYLVLSEEARDKVMKDAMAWSKMGFQELPMLTPPENGGYLTVKRRPVSNKGAPSRDATTDPKGTWQWNTACDVLAGTPWYVNREYLHYLDYSHSTIDTVHDELVIGDHKRLGKKPFWLPIYMDFRGRLYPRTHTVNYQGSDLQKSLLCFSDRDDHGWELSEKQFQAIALHFSALAGVCDKASLQEQIDWWRMWEGQDKVQSHDPIFSYGAQQAGIALKDNIQVLHPDKPHQFRAHHMLLRVGKLNQIPIQIDGTCNGLQHLSAMFEDEEAAPHVNLVDGDTPGDIYKVVAEKTLDTLEKYKHEGWAQRISNLKIDRKLTKGVVMPLPYGMTRSGAEDAVIGKAVKQSDIVPTWWRECLKWTPEGWKPDEEAIAGGYLAYADRDLEHHPLFKLDCKRLTLVIWEEIEKTIPKAMQAMQAFKDIVGVVGDNVLEWKLGPMDNDLVIKQAKSKAAMKRMRLKGLHLPDSVRTIQMLAGRGEVDSGYHRSGIVANFIHSHDADHLCRTMSGFKRIGGTSFGATHDCFMARPSEIELLHKAVRTSFFAKYNQAHMHPLHQAVTIRHPKSGKSEAEYPTWFAFAEECGISFPSRGSLDLSEVLKSKWFFS